MSIVEYFRRIESWPHATRTQAINGVLNWGSCRVLPEKIVHADFLDIASFYEDDVRGEDRGAVPPEIRDSVSAVIAADPELGRALRKSVMPYELVYDAFWWWFTSFAKWFPKEFSDTFSEELKDPACITLFQDLVQETGIKRMAQFIEFYGYNGFLCVAEVHIDMHLANDYSLLRRELKTRKGRKDVLYFWRKTKSALDMICAGDDFDVTLTNQVQEFLIKEVLLRNKGSESCSVTKA